MTNENGKDEPENGNNHRAEIELSVITSLNEKRHISFDLSTSSINENNAGGKGSPRDKNSPRREAVSIKDSNEEGFMLYQALSDAGRLSSCVVAAEVWMLDDTRTKLIRPPGGIWVCPAFFHCGGENEEAMSRLTNSTREDYVPPAPLAPGTGLAGALWIEVSDRRQFAPYFGRRSKRSFRKQTSTLSEPAISSWKIGMDPSRREAEIDAAADRKIAAMEEQLIDNDDQEEKNKEEEIHNEIVQGNRFHGMDERKVAWREVTAIAIDPDQPYNPRLNLLAKAGFGLAAGVPFNIHGIRGIVVYMTRETADQEKMKNPQNESYLRAATTVCGSICAFQAHRQVALQRRDEKNAEAFGKLRTGLKRASAKRLLDQFSQGNLSPTSTGTDVEDKTSVDAKKQEQHDSDGKGGKNILASLASYLRLAKDHVVLAGRKFISGGNVQPPPPMTWSQSFFTLVGVFISLIAITQFNEGITNASDGEASMVLGPFGALMTLQYGLTAAPASQPRNAILGQILSMSVAVCISYANGLEKWFRQTLSTSLSVACMCKLGITHPPAGAAALIFAGGSYDWADVGANMAGNVVAIVVASWINNLNEKRQYPTFWGIKGYWSDLLSFWKGCTEPNKEVLEIQTKRREKKGV